MGHEWGEDYQHWAVPDDGTNNGAAPPLRVVVPGERETGHALNCSADLISLKPMDAGDLVRCARTDIEPSDPDCVDDEL
jgi:hypothetical protein